MSIETNMAVTEEKIDEQREKERAKVHVLISIPVLGSAKATCA